MQVKTSTVCLKIQRTPPPPPTFHKNVLIFFLNEHVPVKADFQMRAPGIFWRKYSNINTCFISLYSKIEYIFLVIKKRTFNIKK